MHRIDNSTAVAVLPTPAAPGVPGYFTGGNPVSGTPATVVEADFLNFIQEELMAFLVAAGITPDKANFAQVLASARKLFGGTPSIGNPGYKPLGHGLILQWVRNKVVTTDVGGNATVTFVFPIAFPNAVLGYSYVGTNEAAATAIGQVVAGAPILSQHPVFVLGGPAFIQVAISGFVIGY